MIEKSKNIDGTEITVVVHGDEILSISECPECGTDGMDIQEPAKAGDPWSCGVCGYQFWL